jgi:hypothetical protein
MVMPPQHEQQQQHLLHLSDIDRISSSSSSSLSLALSTITNYTISSIFSSHQRRQLEDASLDNQQQQQQQYHDNDDDPSSSTICVIYDKNDFFTVLVQLLLAFMALCSLWYKRLTEIPRRKFHTWMLDVSKQGIGATYAHVLNMLVAATISQNIRGSSGSNNIQSLDDQCAWYGMSYLIDTTVGLVLAIIMLHWLDILANQYQIHALKDSGIYSGPHAHTHWLAQVMAWLLILTIVKLILFVLIWIFSEPLAILGGILFAPLQGSIRFELLFVMILFPGCLNGTLL